ncbi:MAG: nitrous oxide reductase accessory protein NosL [Hyphomicrobiales bacterium]|nr:nitrous oxide reductase accessory protein NosL [Hyphomicrobiales bacterium]
MGRERKEPNMCNNHRHGIDRRTLIGGLAALSTAAGTGLLPRRALADAAAVDLPAPGLRDTCPVCGMFVAKYPDWIATVLFADGKVDHFDGAKDFFKYFAEIGKYAPGRSIADITGMGVTDYYSVTRIDARAALYAIGSDVLGPMGHELVPLRTEADAAEFMTDHAGKRLLRFDDVAMPLLIGLDEGRFE